MKLIYYKLRTAIILCLCLLSFYNCKSQTDDRTEDSLYTYKKGDVNGIGKWYMGREIAGIMSYRGISWLERASREKEENTSKLINNLGIEPTDTIADIGAGSGYHSFKMASKAKEGLIYSVDIQEGMLEAISEKKKETGVQNITIVLGNDKSTELPDNSVDKVVMVDVYHEFSYPLEMLLSIKKALKPGGKIYLLEYKAEDPKIRIKRVHKMSIAQATKEFEAAGFKLERNIDNLPLQHCMIFSKN